MLAACTPSAIVRADALMRVVPVDTTVLLDDAITDNKLFRGELGQYNGIRIIPASVAGWSKMLARDASRPPSPLHALVGARAKWRPSEVQEPFIVVHADDSAAWFEALKG
jgi:hypothetical protein